jgi:uncharacterized membrane protein YkvA (DUF1232 family)
MKHLVSFLDVRKKYCQLLEQKKTRWITIALTLVYLFNPFDLIPDFIFGLGVVDDTLLATLLITSLLSMRRKKKND